MNYRATRTHSHACTHTHTNPQREYPKKWPPKRITYYEVLPFIRALYLIKSHKGTVCELDSGKKEKKKRLLCVFLYKSFSSGTETDRPRQREREREERKEQQSIYMWNELRSRCWKEGRERGVAMKRASDG